MTKKDCTLASCVPALGRPRSFDTDEALQQALKVFWEKGYESTSLNDLTKAMGINKPSLYSAFGNKEQLFLKAMELYEKRPNSFFHIALEQPTAYEMVESMLLGGAEHLSDKDQPLGCMLMQATQNCNNESGRVIKEAVNAKRARNAALIKQRFEEAKQQGDLPPDTDTDALTSYISTIFQGMSMQATNGASCEDLKKIATVALAAIPR